MANEENESEERKEANKICPRCNQPFMAESRGEIYCSRCSSYRYSSLSNVLIEATNDTIKDSESKKCPQCKGRGYLQGGGKRLTCSMCHGKAYIDNYDGVYNEWDPETVEKPEVKYNSRYDLNGEIDMEETLAGLSKEMRSKVKARLPSDFSKSNCCYITSACLDDLGLPRACLEMVAMEILTQDYILKSFKGKKDYVAYGRRAPLIVRSIRSQNQARVIWSQIYNVLKEITPLILSEAYEEGYKEYKDLVLSLEKQFGNPHI